MARLGSVVEQPQEDVHGEDPAALDSGGWQGCRPRADLTPAIRVRTATGGSIRPRHRVLAGTPVMRGSDTGHALEDGDGWIQRLPYGGYDGSPVSGGWVRG